MKQSKGGTRRALVATLVVGIGASAALLPNVLQAQDADRTSEVRQAIDGRKARNVIQITADGTGDQQLTIARNYLVGAAGRLVMDTLPLTGEIATWSVQEANPALPDYDSESASGGTALATGQKTSDGRISTAAGTDTDLPTTIELARAAGLRTGNVTTAELTDATPAAQMAHVRIRTCQGPADMAACPQDLRANGGPGSIAEQSIDHDVDVMLGGGRARYVQTILSGPGAGGTVEAYAQAQGYQVVTDKAGLSAVTNPKVLGLFNSGNMTTEFGGSKATNPPSAQTCTTGLRPANEPSLAEMTTKAIRLLDRTPHDSRKGFFLQVEGALADKRDHTAEPCHAIGELKGLDEAVRVALDFAKQDGRTLVLLTADHNHSSLIVEVGSTPPGLSSILTTVDGAQMQVYYGAPETTAPGSNNQHSGGQVRVAAYGPQAANVVGVNDQTEVPAIIRRALGI